MKAREYWKGQGENFMTPYVLEYFDLANGLLVELSEGTGFNHEPIFGVSVADRFGERLGDPISTMFHSKAKAKAHIRLLERLGNES